jgi:hypothetical protein
MAAFLLIGKIIALMISAIWMTSIVLLTGNERIKHSFSGVVMEVLRIMGIDSGRQMEITITHYISMFANLAIPLLMLTTFLSIPFSPNSVFLPYHAFVESYFWGLLIILEAAIFMFDRKNMFIMNTKDRAHDDGSPILIPGKEASDEENELDRIQRLAENGDAQSQFKLGSRFRKEFNHEKAMNWFQRAAEQGYADAQCALGMEIVGSGNRERDGIGASWVEKAARQGHKNAQYQLAFFYKMGIGVEKDSRKSAEWLLRSAPSGTGVVEFELGRMYAVGDGVQKDKLEAQAWFRKVPAGAWDRKAAERALRELEANQEFGSRESPQF